MAEYLLLALLFLSLVTLYLQKKIVFKTDFDQVIQAYLCITILDVLTALIWFYFFREKLYLEWSAPFGLCYGPLFYLAYKASNGITLGRKQILLHALPFVLFYIFYLYFIISSQFRVNYEEFYFEILYGVMTISMISYVSWGVFYKGIEGGLGHQNKMGEMKQLVASTGMIFSVMVLFSIAYMYVRYTGGLIEGPKSFIYAYSIMLAILLATFRYTVRQLVGNTTIANAQLSFSEVPLPMDPNNKEERVSYQKSAVSDVFLGNYEEKLNRKIEEKVYLDPELTLDSLAAELKVTKHHLTQILNLGVGKNFTQYINGYRIEHACNLLRDSKVDLTVEELALESGFNSKSSFNRNFKLHIGCTPSEYRSSLG